MVDEKRRETPEKFVDGNKRLDKLLKDKPHLAEKVRELREKWSRTTD